MATPTESEILIRRAEIHRLRGEQEIVDRLLEEAGATLADVGDAPDTLLNPPRTCGRREKISDRTIGRVFAAIAAGTPQREIAELLGVSRWTVWEIQRRLKQCVELMLSLGDSEKEVREYMGPDRWATWIAAKDWHAGRKAKAAAMKSAMADERISQLPNREIADMFGVDYRTVQRNRHGKKS